MTPFGGQARVHRRCRQRRHAGLDHRRDVRRHADVDRLGRPDAGHYGGTSTHPQLDLTVANGQLYFVASTRSPRVSSGLWASDGTPGGTSEFVPLPTSLTSILAARSTASPTAANLTAVGSNLFFSLDYSFNDETASRQRDSSGPRRGRERDAAQVPAAGGPSSPISPNFMALGSTLLFEAGRTPAVTELWTSDGTAGGTTELKVISPSATSYDDYESTRQALVNNGISTSRPTTAPTARSSGRPTARRPGPSWSTTSIPAQLVEPDPSGRGQRPGGARGQRRDPRRRADGGWSRRRQTPPSSRRSRRSRPPSARRSSSTSACMPPTPTSRRCP